MPLYNQNRKRLCCYSINDLEAVLDKRSYPITRNPSKKLTIGEVAINYFNLNIETFFRKGYRCSLCGLQGSFFALEQGSPGVEAYSLFLYGMDDDCEISFVTSRIVYDGSKKAARNLMPLCMRCSLTIQGDVAGNRKRFELRLDNISTEGIDSYVFKRPQMPVFIDEVPPIPVKNTSNLEYSGKLINGKTADLSNITGYCGNATHWGWLSWKLIESHRCIEKECPYLEKVNEAFWRRREAKALEKRWNRQMSKKEREFIKNRDDLVRSVFSMRDGVLVTMIEVIEPSRYRSGGLRITYTCKRRIKTTEEEAFLRKALSCNIIMNPVFV